jgi:hypothetical protein
MLLRAGNHHPSAERDYLQRLRRALHSAFTGSCEDYGYTARIEQQWRASAISGNHLASRLFNLTACHNRDFSEQHFSLSRFRF